jgi:ectoine hydroxylase-related dioxygenase (phytanoyl-CoA dioxygenase family)
MTLTDFQKNEFAERGIIKLPGIVPREMVLAARRAINAHLGANGMHPDELPILRAQTYCRSLTREPVITDLFNRTAIKPILVDLCGSIRTVNSGQIALRFPSESNEKRVNAPHLDGMYSPTNGMKEGTIGNFTALVGVFLSDLPEPFSGNFAAWPGSHKKYEAYFQEHTPQALLNGLPPVDIGEPEQFLGQAGDAALVHYQIAHTIATNQSANIRYAIFFRVFHSDHGDPDFDCMTNIWREWPGIRAGL